MHSDQHMLQQVTLCNEKEIIGLDFSPTQKLHWEVVHVSSEWQCFPSPSAGLTLPSQVLHGLTQHHLSKRQVRSDNRQGFTFTWISFMLTGSQKPSICFTYQGKDAVHASPLSWFILFSDFFRENKSYWQDLHFSSLSGLKPTKYYLTT